MKRESGESPEQSRCCKLLRAFVQKLKPLPLRWEGEQTGVSQKTCKTSQKTAVGEDTARHNDSSTIFL